MLLDRRKLRLGMAGAIALAGAALVESARADPAGYRCIDNTQGAGTEIARPVVGDEPSLAPARCTAACESTRGCIAYNIVHGVEGGRDIFICILLGSVSAANPFDLIANRQYGALCYRLAGPVPPGSARDCPPHKPGCVPPRPFADPRPPSAVDDRPGQARPPASAPGKK